MDNVKFVDRINLSLKSRHISKGKFYEDLGLANNSSTNWNKRGTIPSADVVLKIADYLGVSVRYLVTGEDNEIPVRIREIVELCRGLDDKELETVCNMLRGLQKRDCPESGTEVV